jgi:hypothetical protein
MSFRDENHEPTRTPTEDMSLAVHELIQAYEEEHSESGDTAFNLEVRLADGTLYSLPYCDHGVGTIVLMDDMETPPRPRVIQMRHVTEVSIDQTCKSTIVRPLAAAQLTLSKEET